MIRILTDSTCDLLPAEAARLGVEVVHMQVRFENGEVFRDGLDITPDEFYSRLRQAAHHQPAQPPGLHGSF